MDEILIMNVIKTALNRYRMENLDIIKPQTKKHLISIETYLQSCIKTYENSVSELDKINLSVRGICNQSNVGKSTVYQNKEVLYTYIKNRVKEIEENFDIFSKKKIFNLEKKNNQLVQRLDNMIVDYIEVANLKLKIEELYKENEKLQKQKDVLAQERIKLIDTKNQLSLELSKLRNNVIEFHKQNR